jgi:hypothetical protein
MSVQRETYAELTHSLIFAYAGGQLSAPQIASVLFACAQPDTTEETTDITHEVRDGLTDWSEQDKGQLIAVEHVHMKFRCVNIHGPCKKGEHTVNMTRVIGSMDWEPEMVSSQHDFNEVIMNCMGVPRHADGTIDGKLIPGRKGGSRGDLISAFKKLFDEPGDPIEQEVKDFRAELDALFPSNPPKGGTP